MLVALAPCKFGQAARTDDAHPHFAAGVHDFGHALRRYLHAFKAVGHSACLGAPYAQPHIAATAAVGGRAAESSGARGAEPQIAQQVVGIFEQCVCLGATPGLVQSLGSQQQGLASGRSNIGWHAVVRKQGAQRVGGGTVRGQGSGEQLAQQAHHVIVGHQAQHPCRLIMLGLQRSGPELNGAPAERATVVAPEVECAIRNKMPAAQGCARHLAGSEQVGPKGDEMVRATLARGSMPVAHQGCPVGVGAEYIGNRLADFLQLLRRRTVERVQQRLAHTVDVAHISHKFS